MFKSIRGAHVVTLGSVVAALGCSVTPSSSGQAPSTGAQPSMSTLAVPADFTFQVTRPIELRIAAPAASSVDHLAVEIRTPAQEVVFRGSVAPGQNLALRLPLAPETTSLEVRTRSGDAAPVSQTVTLDSSSQAVAVNVGGA
jgi:hypothetical protein